MIKEIKLKLEKVEVNKKVLNKLCNELKEFGLYQEEIAKLLGITPSLLSRYLT